MKKIILIFFTLLLYFQSILAQFDPQYSQYMMNHSAYNPAAAAESGMIDIIGQYRLQWLGMPNGGKTFNFSVMSPLKINKTEHAIGLKFLDDKVGIFTNQGAHLTYAYKRPLWNGKLSIGADIGLISIGLNYDSITAHVVNIGDYFDLSDPAIPTSSVVGMTFDTNFGLWYSNENLFTGVSVSHLNQPVVDWGTTTELKPASTMFLTGGYNFKLPYKNLIITPSFFYKTDFTSSQIDLSGKLELEKKYWGGLSYRYGDAVVLFGGLNIAGGLSIGYSYDLPVSKIINASWGSHEICMIYSFEYISQKTMTKYKSIRIL
jgi:type IX secretion system PorP/SprF family membrane protein